MTATLQADRAVGLRDIGRRLDRLPVGPVHRRVVLAIGLGLFFEVYEIFVSSTIATALKTEYGLGGTALQLLMAEHREVKAMFQKYQKLAEAGGRGDERMLLASQICAVYYFSHFLIIVPIIAAVEKTLPLPNSISESVLKPATATT